MNRQNGTSLHRACVLTAFFFAVAGGCVAATVPATTERDRAPSEKYVLEQIAIGEPALLGKNFPDKESRVLPASFLKALLTNPLKEIEVHPHGIIIDGAVVRGDIDLVNEDIPYDVILTNCEFENDLNLTQAHFAKSLSIEKSVFRGSLDFSSTNISFDFSADGSQFQKYHSNDDTPDAFFKSMKVGGDFLFRDVVFTGQVDLTEVEIGGNFLVDRSLFHDLADFESLKVKGDGFFRNTTLEDRVDLSDARFTNLFLTDSQFNSDKEGTNFTRLKMEAGFLENAIFNGPLKIEGMTFQNLTPASWDKLKELARRSEYNAEFYSNLEALFLRHGYPDQAKAVFIAQRQRERKERPYGLDWGWDLLQDWVVGYGRHLERLLLWSAILVVIGYFVFRHEGGMATKRPKDAEDCKSKYSAFWYSLDLFLPIIDLGEAETWTPKEERRVAIFYKRIHIILGHLLIPIGLAAWTGIIK